MIDLKPCPFCGSGNLDLSNLVDEDDWFVSCCQCGTQQIANHTKQEAINRWNSRAEPDMDGISERERKLRLLVSAGKLPISAIDTLYLIGVIDVIRGGRTRIKEEVFRLNLAIEYLKRRTEEAELRVAQLERPHRVDGKDDLEELLKGN